MLTVTATRLPEGALLQKYCDGGAYTDCFSTEVFGHVSQAQFITAFYTSLIFRTERQILKWLVSKPSTDRDVVALADGAAESFAAWTVEGQTENQLLLIDYAGRTRSWLMTNTGKTGTRLYFGSAIVPAAQRASISWAFRAMLPFHRAYSVTLLHAARASLSGRSA